MPFLLAGHWWTPLPKRIPCMFAVGTPIEPVQSDLGEVTQADVDDLHRRYYEGVVQLWRDCKQKHPEYGHVTLQFDKDIGVDISA